MASLPESARTALEAAVLDGEQIVAGHLHEQRKIRNMGRDPRVALSVDAGTRYESGLDEYLVVYGTARITEGGAADLLRQLAYACMGPDVKFPAMGDPPPGYITHITVERVSGVGHWVS